MLTAILIFSIFLSPLTAGIKMQFDLTGDCSSGQYWCLRQKIYEIDWANDDYLGTSISCGTGQLNTVLTAHEDGDGWFDDEMELKSEITHSCADKKQKGSDEYYLTTFDSHSSASNYEKVSADYSPSQPIKYNVGDLYNKGKLTSCI